MGHIINLRGTLTGNSGKGNYSVMETSQLSSLFLLFSPTPSFGTEKDKAKSVGIQICRLHLDIKEGIHEYELHFLTYRDRLYSCLW